MSEKKTKKVTKKKAKKVTTKKKATTKKNVITKKAATKKVITKKATAKKKTSKKKIKGRTNQFELLEKTMTAIASKFKLEVNFDEYFNADEISYLLQKVWWGEYSQEGLSESIPDCDIATTNIINVNLQYYAEDLDPAWDDSYYAVNYSNVEISFVISILGKTVYKVPIDVSKELTRDSDKDMDRFDDEFIDALTTLNDIFSKIDLTKLEKGINNITNAEKELKALFE